MYGEGSRRSKARSTVIHRRASDKRNNQRAQPNLSLSISTNGATVLDKAECLLYFFMQCSQYFSRRDQPSTRRPLFGPTTASHVASAYSPPEEEPKRSTSTQLWSGCVTKAGSSGPCGEERLLTNSLHSNTYFTGSRTLLLWHLSDRSDPEGSAFEDIWIDRFHTYLADPMTKLSL